MFRGRFHGSALDVIFSQSLHSHKSTTIVQLPPPPSDRDFTLFRYQGQSLQHLSTGNYSGPKELGLDGHGRRFSLAVWNRQLSRTWILEKAFRRRTT